MPVMLGDDEILNRVPFTTRSICPLKGFFPAFHSFFSPTISAVAGGHLIRFHESVYGHYFGALPSLMPWIIDGSWISMQEFNSFIYLYPGQGFQWFCSLFQEHWTWVMNILCTELQTLRLFAVSSSLTNMFLRSVKKPENLDEAQSSLRAHAKLQMSSLWSCRVSDSDLLVNLHSYPH